MCDNAHLYERNQVNSTRYVVRRQKSIFETRRYNPCVPPYEPKVRMCFETWRSVSFETREDEAVYRNAAAGCYASSPLASYSTHSSTEADMFNIMVDGVRMTGSVRTHRFNMSMSGGGTTTMVIDCQAQNTGEAPDTTVYLTFDLFNE